MQLGVTLNQWVSNVSVRTISLEVLWKHKWLGPNPRGSDSGGLRWGPRICIYQLPVYAGAVGLGQDFGNHWAKVLKSIKGINMEGDMGPSMFQENPFELP